MLLVLIHNKYQPSIDLEEIIQLSLIYFSPKYMSFTERTICDQNYFITHYVGDDGANCQSLTACPENRETS